MEEKEYVFTTSYNPEKLGKISKYVNAKPIKTNIVMLILESIMFVLCTVIGILQHNKVLYVFAFIFVILVIVFIIHLYKLSTKYIKKNFNKFKQNYPVSVTIKLEETIKLHNILLHGEGTSEFNYSGIKEAVIVDEYVLIRFIDNRIVAFEADDKQDVINYINKKIKEEKGEK